MLFHPHVLIGNVHRRIYTSKLLTTLLSRLLPANHCPWTWASAEASGGCSSSLMSSIPSWGRTFCGSTTSWWTCDATDSQTRSRSCKSTVFGLPRVRLAPLSFLGNIQMNMRPYCRTSPQSSNPVVGSNL